MDSAEVVIVGGGVMAASIAFHLATAGVTDVLVLEANELGSGSSGKPLGGVRAQFSSPANVRLGARSLAAYRRFPQQVGVEVGLEQVGYLFLLRTAADLAGFEASVAMQNDLGVPSRIVSAGQARELNPFLDVDGVLGAAFSPDDGYAHPGSVVHGYARAAAQLGVRLRTGTRVTGLDLAGVPGSSGTAGVSGLAGAASVAGVGGTEIVGVRTTAGPVATGTVICAAGAWSAAIGEMAGVELPVEPVRRQIAFTAPLSPAPPLIPFTIDFDSTFYFHGAGAAGGGGPGSAGGVGGAGGLDAGTLLLGLAEPGQPVGFDTDYDERWLPELRAAASRCAPSLASVEFGRGWAGLYEVTPDHNALIGQSPLVSRFLYATGFSGHGFLQAPAVGEIIRDLYLGVQPFCDISDFDALRFTTSNPAGDQAHPEQNIV